MLNLVIGLCFGLAAAIVLVVLWRAAERLRKEVQARDAQPDESVTQRSYARKPRPTDER